MVVFILTSQIMRCTIEYQYSCQYSYEYLSTCPRVRVQVWVLLLWNSRVRIQHDYQKFSTQVLRVWVPSTSTPAVVPSHVLAVCGGDWCVTLMCWVCHIMGSIPHVASHVLALCGGDWLLMMWLQEQTTPSLHHPPNHTQPELGLKKKCCGVPLHTATRVAPKKMLWTSWSCVVGLWHKTVYVSAVPHNWCSRPALGDNFLSEESFNQI